MRASENHLPQSFEASHRPQQPQYFLVVMSGRRNSYVELDSAKKSKILAPYSTPCLLKRRASLIILQGRLVISVPWNNNNVRVQDKGGDLSEGVVNVGPVLPMMSHQSSSLFPTCTGTFIPESRALPTSAAEWREDCSGEKIDFWGS